MTTYDHYGDPVTDRRRQRDAELPRDTTYQPTRYGVDVIRSQPFADIEFVHGSPPCSLVLVQGQNRIFLNEAAVRKVKTILSELG